jgi:hypothetical protein
MEDIDTILVTNMEMEEIINYCSTDKNKLKSCLTRKFWLPFFNKHNLVLPTIKFKSLEDVIDQYEKSKAMKLKNELMDVIPDNYININTNHNLTLTDYLRLMSDSGMMITDWKEDVSNKNITSDTVIVDHIEIDGELENIWLYLQDEKYKYTIFFDYNVKQLENFLYNGFYNDMLYVRKI